MGVRFAKELLSLLARTLWNHLFRSVFFFLGIYLRFLRYRGPRKSLIPKILEKILGTEISDKVAYLVFCKKSLLE